MVVLVYGETFEKPTASFVHSDKQIFGFGKVLTDAFKLITILFSSF